MIPYGIGSHGTDFHQAVVLYKYSVARHVGVNHGWNAVMQVAEGRQYLSTPPFP